MSQLYSIATHSPPDWGTVILCFDYDFGKRMAAIFELYFQFQFRHMCVVDGMPFNVSLPNLVVIGRSVAEL